MFAFAKRKMLLQEIAENHHNHCINDLRNGGIKSQPVHHHGEVDVVEQQAHHIGNEIAKELVSATHGTAAKHHIFSEVKTDGKRKQERGYHRRFVRLEYYQQQIDGLFIEHIVFANEKDEQPQQGIAATTGRIIEGLPRHEAFEQRIKPVEYQNDEPCQHMRGQR